MRNVHFTALQRILRLVAPVLGISMYSPAWCNNLNYDVITPGAAGYGGFAVTPAPFGFQEWGLQIPGTTVAPNPNSTLLCDMGASFPSASFCYNDEYFYSASGVYLGSSLAGGNGSVDIFPGAGGVVIENSNRDPLAVMYYGCGPEAVCDMILETADGGGVLDLSTVPLLFSFAVADAPAVVAYGGIQDVIDVKFYDGTSASFGVVLSTPEPATLILVAPILIALLAAARQIGSPHSRRNHRTLHQPLSTRP